MNRNMVGVISTITSKETIKNYGFKYLKANVDVIDTFSYGEPGSVRWFQMSNEAKWSQRIDFPNKVSYELKIELDDTKETLIPAFHIGCYRSVQFIDLLINDIYLSTY